jgi:hypothetical protein
MRGEGRDRLRRLVIDTIVLVILVLALVVLLRVTYFLIRCR